MTISNNVSALTAMRMLSAGITQSGRASERLASGNRINRAADDAAGLSISEKLLAQISGDYQAIRNANMGISLIRTAEGALDETHAMLGRVNELALQASNGILNDEQRGYIQMEIDQIMSEVDRIANSTNFNGIKLLDGSMGQNGSTSANGMNSPFGAQYGIRQFSTEFNQYVSVSSNKSDVGIEFTLNAGKGGENAFWDSTGRKLTVNLAESGVYSDAQINTLIKNAYSQGNAASVEFKSDAGQIVAVNAATNSTVTGVRQYTSLDLDPLISSGAAVAGFADNITFIANQFGSSADTAGVFSDIKIVTDAAKGEEKVVDSGGAGKGIELHLATDTEYTAQSIAGILKSAGYDYTVEMSSSTPISGETTALFQNVGETGAPVSSMEGAGLGKIGFGANGSKGLTLQIGGNNAVEQRMTVYINAMDSRSIGLSGVDVRTAQGALSAIDMVGGAISAVSRQRALLGAQENRLEHTVNSLTVKHENEIAANAQIRDADMAEEMINYSKNNLLRQVAMSMLAQANQIPQLMLQLLK